MSQEEVLKILEKKELITAGEIADMLGISVMAVRGSLNKMLKFNEVEKIKLDVRNLKGGWRKYIWKPVDIKVSKEKMEKYNGKNKY
jgi:predicted transcriptional regulator